MTTTTTHATETRFTIWYRHESERNMVPPPQERKVIVYAATADEARREFAQRLPSYLIESIVRAE